MDKIPLSLQGKNDRGWSKWSPQGRNDRKWSLRQTTRITLVLILLGFLGFIYVKNNPDSYIESLVKNPEGRKKLFSITEKIDVKDPVVVLEENFKKLSTKKTRSLQFALHETGYYKGTIDGLWGSQTENAIRQYAKDTGLELSLRRVLNDLNRKVRTPEYVQLNYPKPENLSTGVLFQDQLNAVAPFSITVPSGREVYAKLRNPINKTDVMTVYINGGKTFKGKAPLGSFELLYAFGSNWYGEKLMFGPTATYKKATKILSFSKAENKINGHRITLITVQNGNLPSQNISAADF